MYKSKNKNNSKEEYEIEYVREEQKLVYMKLAYIYLN